MTSIAVIVVTGAIESPAYPFSGGRSYRLSYVTMSIGEAGRQGPLPVVPAWGFLPFSRSNWI
jgi:hypothetical protein